MAHAFYRLPEAARDWTPEQRASYTFGRQQDHHYRAWVLEQALAVSRQRAAAVDAKVAEMVARYRVAGRV